MQPIQLKKTTLSTQLSDIWLSSQGKKSVNMKKSSFTEQPSENKNIFKGVGFFLFLSKYLSTGR